MIKVSASVSPFTLTWKVTAVRTGCRLDAYSILDAYSPSKSQS